MAFRAFALLRPRLELTFVRIRFVAVDAIRKRQRLLEVAVHMALRAADRRVLAQQGVFRFRVIEFKLRLKFFPACGRVAVLAAFGLERAFVRVHMAIDAGRELHVLVADRPARHIGLMTFLAGHFDVLTGQRITRLRVIELLGGFPIHEVVALQAVVAELAFVRILVTGDALLRKAEERLGGIRHLDERTFRAHHVHRRMTLLAGGVRVLPFEDIAGLLVVKLFLGRLPVNEMEVLAVVLQMAANAVLAVGILHSEPRVVAVLGVEPPGNFLVAVETLKGRRAGSELVATRALRCAGQGFMRFGKRPGRDLRVERRRCEQEREKTRQAKSGLKGN